MPFKFKLGFAILCMILDYNSISAQVYYALDGDCHRLYEVDITHSDCDCELTLISNNTPCLASGALTFDENGVFYMLASVLGVGIYTITLPTGAYSLTYPLDPSVLPPLDLSRGLVNVGNGLFYFGFGIDDFSDKLFRYNANSGSLTELGIIPFKTGSDWAFYDGEIYCFGYESEGLIILDTLNPGNSHVVCASWPPYWGGIGVTASPFCHSILFTGPSTDTIFNINLLDCAVTPLCHLNTNLWWIISPAEFEPSPFCSGLIDLDCDNSSGALESDYNANPFDCLSAGVTIADEDDHIFIDDIISTMTIELIDPLPNAPDEKLFMNGSVNGINVTGSGSTFITLTNTGGADSRDFQDALRMIVYKNVAPYPVSGLRTVLVQFTSIAGTQSNVASAFITVNELPIIPVDLGPDLILCEGELATFDATTPGATYHWSNGPQTPTITVGNAGQYMVTVSNGQQCPGMDTIELDLIPVIHVSLTGDTEICKNELDSLILSSDSPFPLTIEISAEPGSPFTFTDVLQHYLFLDWPGDNTIYTITDIIPSEPACIVLTDPEQVVDLYPTYQQNATFDLCDGDSVLIGGNWIDQAGTYDVHFETTHQCDSLVSYIVSLLPSVMLDYSMMSCDSSQVGIFISYLNNPTGCDTVVKTTVSLSPPDTTTIQLTTCQFSQAGISYHTSQNLQGCDSLIITTTSYIPPMDTTWLFGTSCDSSLLGVSSQTISNQVGCDSIILTTITFGIPDTTMISTTSCDSSSLGVSEQHFLSATGCDSTVITTISYSLSDSTFLLGTTCDPNLAGIFLQHLTNRFGCDSIVTSTISLSLTDSTFLFNATCNLLDSGIFITHFVNQAGCDSVVTETISFIEPDSTFLFGTSCHSSEVGVFTNTFPNQVGCDSVTILTVSLLSADSTILTTMTCDPGLVGIETNILQNQQGCDSLVISEAILFPPSSLAAQVDSDFNGFGTSCFGAEDGSGSVVASGHKPFAFLWSNGQSGEFSNGLGEGIYSVTLTDGYGCQFVDSILITQPELFTITLEVSQPNCFDIREGTLLVHPIAGILPVSYSIDGIHFQSSPLFEGLTNGIYTITALDANDCKAKEIVLINVPIQLTVTLGDDQVIEIGDTTILTAILNVPFDSLAAIQWDGLVNPDCTDCPTQPVAPIISSTYSITVNSNEGCSAEDEVTITIHQQDDLFIPNVFSPNGDQINDLFLISSSGQIKEILRLDIYDRWGNMVFLKEHFQPNDDAASWDGTWDNKLLNPGVFAYKAIFQLPDGTQSVRYGDVTLIR